VGEKELARGNPTTKAWIWIHVIFPLTPLLIDSVLRLLVNNFALTISTVNAATLSMSMGLLSLFVSHSLMNSEPAIRDANYNEDIKGTVAIFNVYTIIAISVFSVLVLLKALIDYCNLFVENIQEKMNVVVYCTFWVPIIHAIFAQKCFKLSAR
jgi:hypothetical protein